MMMLYHLVRADFLERTRRYSFLVMLGAVIYLGFLVNDGTIGVMLGKYRGDYNTAWVGAMMSLVATFFLSWFGFYLVKNSIQRDERTGVGQIIATTPLSGLRYVAGKALSNFVVLAIMVLILIVAAIILQLFSGEVSGFNMWDLISPFLLITLPVLAVVAACAVLFESVPFLNGGLGNVTYFFGWMALMTVGFELQSDLLDLAAMNVVSESMKGAARAAFPDYGGGFVIGSSGQAVAGTFRWDGIAWTPALVMIRFGWLLLAPLIVLVASFMFHRFDPSRERTFQRKPVVSAADEVAVLSPARTSEPRHLSLTPLPVRFRFGHLVVAELRLLLKGRRWWWYGVQLGLIVACLAAPLNEARQIALPFAWIWPLLIWSSMGTREELFRTSQIVFSAPYSLSRQLPAVFVAGVVVAMIAGGGILLRLLVDGDSAGVAMWIAAAMFVPAFALASGVWSGSGKLFEVLYLCLWYIGPLNKTAELDFIGVVGVTAIPLLPLVYLVVAVALYAAAYIGRRRALQQ